ncbi:MAG: DnaJ domain-containing protein [Thiomicrorhabdus sp.]|nr:DnaJ domain-containing protein [Thiomicrorhabdus sp.]
MKQHYDRSVDYFAVLGVHYGACEKTVKVMYRKMARRYHPDVSTIHDAQKKFQEVAVAYEVLKKHRKAYCFDYEQYLRSKRGLVGGSTPSNYSSEQRNTKPQESTKEYSDKTYHSHQAIHGKNRVITYPLTLRYAIRLLKLGSFYIPGLKVKMKFTREAFSGKTFRLKGKGYKGLFGGLPGDYLVRFTIQLDSLRFQLEGADIYGTFYLPALLIKAGKKLELESPSGRLCFVVPKGYESKRFIKVKGMGIPADHLHKAGDFYVRLVRS